MLFKSGSRTRRRATFFCAASHKDVANAENAGAFFGQKQVTKEKVARLPLMSCAPRTCALWGICRGTAEWASCPSAAVRHPCRNPSGYSRQMLRCSTRQTGENALLRNVS